MKKMVGCSSFSCSLAMIASFVAYMQQTAEQYGCSWSRLPTHWMKAIFRGTFPSDGRFTWPMVGPEAERIRSNWRALTTLGYRPKPYSCERRAL